MANAYAATLAVNFGDAKFVLKTRVSRAMKLHATKVSVMMDIYPESEIAGPLTLIGSQKVCNSIENGSKTSKKILTRLAEAVFDIRYIARLWGNSLR